MCTYFGKKYDKGEVFYDGCMRCKCDAANGAYSLNCVCKRGVYPGRYVLYVVQVLAVLFIKKV